MKRIFILFFTVLISVSVHCQSFITEGDSCFNKGEYSCAEKNYNEALKLKSGKEKQLVEIKLTRTKWCSQHLKSADIKFANGEYQKAKEDYQRVLESNSKDFNAKLQIEKCNNILNPIAVTLTVSNSRLTFSEDGGEKRITVYTNADSYSIIKLPDWCTVKEYSDYFVIYCRRNYGSSERSVDITIQAKEKSVQIKVTQLGAKTKANSTEESRSENNQVTSGEKEVKRDLSKSDLDKSNTPQKERSQNNTKSTSLKKKNCFNCPKATYLWGLSLGYNIREFDPSIMEDDSFKMDAIQIGFRVEPLFKYGFGLNTGIFYEHYAFNFYKPYYYENYIENHINIPLHMEYRFNINKYFNLFIYGGISSYVNIDKITLESFFENYSLNTSFDYGGGVRINHFQINIEHNMNKMNPKLLTISCSYMF